MILSGNIPKRIRGLRPRMRKRYDIFRWQVQQGTNERYEKVTGTQEGYAKVSGTERYIEIATT